ncbi:MAG: hypothetical protein KF709_04025 [Gemmatimonadaceae bacterium]|nr:hypothetical protein [Gemmatimonadaceae bacterium]
MGRACMRRAPILLSLVLGAAIGACARGDDIATVGAKLPPFDALQGIPAKPLRVLQLRSVRREIAPRAEVGMAEIIAGYEVEYHVPVFDSTSLWPREDAMILDIVASRQFASDSAAHDDWDAVATAIRAALPDVTPCPAADPTGRWTAIEFPRGDSLVLSAEYEPAYLLMDSTRTVPTTRLAIRHGSRCQ